MLNKYIYPTEWLESDKKEIEQAQDQLKEFEKFGSKYIFSDTNPYSNLIHNLKFFITNRKQEIQEFWNNAKVNT